MKTLLISLINSTLALLGGGAVVAYSDDTDTVNYWKPQVIVGTTTKSGYCYLGGGQYALTSPNFRMQYTGDTLTSLYRALTSSSNITSIDKWTLDTSKITDMSSMFQNCYPLASVDLSHFDTSAVTTMQQMFDGCSSLTSLDLSNFDTSKVTNMNTMFHNCYKLNSIDVSNWNTSNVQLMSLMFYECSSLTSLNISSFDVSNVTYMGLMFGWCTSLVSLDLSSFDTSAVTTMQQMFDGCSSLTSLNISSFNFSAVTNVDYMFDYCPSLTDLQFGTNLKVSLGLSDSPLTHTSALSVFNGLATITKSQSITFKASTYSTLTAAEIKTATDKGWTITSV